MFVSLLGLIFSCKKIRLAIAIVKTGTNYIGSVLSCLFIPAINAIPMVVSLFIFLWTILLLYSTGDKDFSTGFCVVTVKME